MQIIDIISKLLWYAVSFQMGMIIAYLYDRNGLGKLRAELERRKLYDHGRNRKEIS